MKIEYLSKEQIKALMEFKTDFENKNGCCITQVEALEESGKKISKAWVRADKIAWKTPLSNEKSIFWRGKFEEQLKVNPNKKFRKFFEDALRVEVITVGLIRNICPFFHVEDTEL